VVVLPKKGAGSYTCFACCQERENQQSGSQSEPHYHCRPPRFTAGGVWLNDTRPPGRRISAARGSMRLMGADDLGVHFERLVRADTTEDTESWSRRWSV